jgi:predicted alpha/beta hydrolase
MNASAPKIAAETLRVPARDGRMLAATLHAADAPVGRLVIVNSATGVRRGYYDRYARFLAGNGLDVLTYDYRGIGDSAEGGIRAQRCRMREWGEIDVASAIDFAASRFPQHRLFAIGHSAGGQMFGLADNNTRVEGLFAVSAQSGYWKHWSGLSRWKLALLWHALMPGAVAAMSYFPSRRIGFGENLPGGVARDWARWCRHPDYLVDDAGKPLRRHFEAYRGRIRACAIADDWMAPQAAVEALMGFYRSAEVEVRRIRPADAGAKSLGHFGYFRETGKPLWQDSLAWFRQP